MKSIGLFLFFIIVGCTPFSTDSLKDERIIVLFKKGDKIQILDLLDKGKLLWEYQTKRKALSLLHLAVLYSDNTFLETLIEQGAPLDLVDSDGNTPLNLAIEKNHKEMAVILIDDQADPNISNKQGNTALLLAIHKGFLDLLTIFLQKMDDRLNPFIQDKNHKRALEYLTPGSPAFQALRDYEQRWEKKGYTRKENPIENSN